MSERSRRRSGSDWLGLASFGLFVIIVGAIWMLTPNLTEEAINFGKDFQLQNVTSNILLPAPEHDHPIVYTAVMQFCLVFGISQIAILALRFIFHEPVDKEAGDASGIVFWLSASYFFSLLIAGRIAWFGLVAGIIICTGLAIVVSSLVKLAR